MRRAAAAIAISSLTACSTAWHKLPATVIAPGESLNADLWVRANAREQSVSFVTDTILFPIDALFSLGAAIAAFGDDNVDIQAGPGGTLVAMLLPFVTATYDGDVDTLEEAQAGKELPYRTRGPVAIVITADAWADWRRGQGTLVDAIDANPNNHWLAQHLRSGDAEIDLIDAAAATRSAGGSSR